MNNFPVVPAEDPAMRAELANMITSAKDLDDTMREIHRISNYLSLALYERRLSDPSGDDAILEKIRDCLLETLKLFETLPNDRKRYVDRLAKGINDTEATIRGLAQAAAQARAELPIQRVINQPFDPEEPDAPHGRLGGGRYPDTAVRACVRALILLWLDQTESWPTIITDRDTHERSGAFLGLTEAVIAPIYKANGMNHVPNLGAVAKRELKNLKKDLKP